MPLVGFDFSRVGTDALKEPQYYATTEGDVVRPALLQSTLFFACFFSSVAFSAENCPEDFQRFKVKGQSFSDLTLQFAQTPYGPALLGLNLSTAEYKGLKTDGIVYNFRLRKWCLFSGQSKPLNCEVLNQRKVGQMGSGGMIFVAGKEAGKIRAVAMHTSQSGELIIYPIDAEKPVSPTTVHRSFDRNQPQLHIMPDVEEMADGQTRSTLQVNSFNAKEAAITGTAQFEMLGSLSEKGELLPKRLNTAPDSDQPDVDLVGQAFVEPHDCRPREIKKYSAPQSGEPESGKRRSGK